MAVEFIDFSPKHDVMIQYPDGRLRPMDEHWFESEQIAPDTWKAKSCGDFCYIVKGDGEALAIDCGYGAGNIRKDMEAVCGVPVPYVANTHDHFDHTAANAYFDKAFMSEKTSLYATIPFPSFAGIDFHADEYERVIVKDGDMIPLKGRPLEVFVIPDHAPGSTMYLDRKERILFTGDEFFAGPFKPLNGGLTSWVNNLQKLKPILNDFDFACGGGGKMNKEHILGMIACAEYALSHIDEAQAPKHGGPGGPPRENHYDSEGHIVYDQSFPHPGDSAEGAYTAEDNLHDLCRPENMRAIEHNGFRISFDITRVNL